MPDDRRTERWSAGRLAVLLPWLVLAGLVGCAERSCIGNCTSACWPMEAEAEGKCLDLCMSRCTEPTP